MQSQDCMTATFRRYGYGQLYPKVAGIRKKISFCFVFQKGQGVMSESKLFKELFGSVYVFLKKNPNRNRFFLDSFPKTLIPETRVKIKGKSNFKVVFVYLQCFFKGIILK